MSLFVYIGILCKKDEDFVCDYNIQQRYEGNTIKLADLASETLERIKTLRWDRIIEKHEGPERN
jgi:hypothetical protein